GWFDAETEVQFLRRLQSDPPAHVILFRRTTPDLAVGPFGEGYGLALVDWCSRNYRLIFSSPKGTIWSRGEPKMLATHESARVENQRDAPGIPERGITRETPRSRAQRAAKVGFHSVPGESKARCWEARR